MVAVNSKRGTEEVKGRRGRERKKKERKVKEHTKIRETQVLGIEACINRLPFFFLSLDKPTL